MALIKCPECGRENVSDTAEACPNCGYGIKKHFEKIKLEEKKQQETKEKLKKDVKPIKVENQYVYNIPKPKKPVFSKGFIVYLVVVTIFLLLLFFINPHKAIREIEEFFLWFFTFEGIPLIIYGIPYLRELSDYHLAQNDFEEYKKKIIKERKESLAKALEEEKILKQEKKYAEYSQSSDNAWGTKYFTDPCPHCGHYKVRYAKWEDKQLSVAFWGVASDKIDKDFKCDYCKKIW